MTHEIVHFMRKPRANVFSIERLYEDVRGAMTEDLPMRVWTCAHDSSGLWPRLRDAWAARKAQGDVNHVTGDTHYLTYFLDRRRTVLTVADLVSLGRLRGLKRWLLWLFWYWLPVKRSFKVVTISECTRAALLKSVRCDPAKVSVIHCPVSAEFQPRPSNWNAERPRVLQIGTTSNKNIERVAEALSGIPCCLVVIGPITEAQIVVLVKHGVSYESLVGLTRAALVEQYTKADMLLFASTYEGFGLPIVEANAVGRPVVTSNLSSMPEVAGRAACLVDPYRVEDIRAGVLKVFGDAGYREQLIEAGFENAKRFRAEAVAAQYAALYREVGEQASANRRSN